MKKKVLIFITARDAESFIEQVLESLQAYVGDGIHHRTEILVIDDESQDSTLRKAAQYQASRPDVPITVLSNPKQQGYGGNQKLGYVYAIQNQFDVVVLLQGDNTYPPDYIPRMIAPVLTGEADAVFGTRMLNPRVSLIGHMSLTAWFGTQTLANFLNRILGSQLSEFHTSYRAYNVTALASVPFSANSDSYDFDTDIIIQLLGTGKVIQEIPVPAHYQDDTSRRHRIRYGFRSLRTAIQSQLVPRGIYYHPKFDYNADNSVYTLKLGYPSSHQFALDHIRPGSTVMDLGCGPGFMARELAKKQVRTISVDRFILPETQQYSYQTIQADVEAMDFDTQTDPIDTVLILDIIEHLKSPETFLLKLRQRYADDDPNIVITTANISFIVTRLSLLFGQFNYGKRGILDMDHTRLFTFASLRRALQNTGYEILEEQGIPAPFPLALGQTALAKVLLKLNSWLIRISKPLFAYQIALVVKPKPTLENLLDKARHSTAERLSMPQR